MTEWMYGIEAGETYGSPADLIGNLRESVAESERKKGVIVAGCIHVHYQRILHIKVGVSTHFEWIENKGLDESVAMRLKSFYSVAIGDTGDNNVAFLFEFLDDRGTVWRITTQHNLHKRSASDTLRLEVTTDQPPDSALLGVLSEIFEGVSSS